MIEATVGIDISKDSFDVACLIQGKYKTKKYSNTIKGFTSLLAWIAKFNIDSVKFCSEATGTYGDSLACFLYDSGYQISVVNPAQIKAFGQCQLSRTKTDKNDAKRIALFCSMMNPKPWKPLPKEIRELQACVKRLDALKAMHQQEKNRLLVCEEAIRPSLHRMLDNIKDEIRELESTIENLISSNKKLAHKRDLLLTIPGIGNVTAQVILSFIGDPNKFKSAKQLVAFLGLNPKIEESGTSVKKRSSMSKMGDSSLRKAFYMPAIVAKKLNPVMMAFCERLKARGKHNMLIMGAAMRKLIHMIYGVLKNNSPFDPSWAS